MEPACSERGSCSSLHRTERLRERPTQVPRSRGRPLTPACRGPAPAAPSPWILTGVLGSGSPRRHHHQLQQLQSALSAQVTRNGVTDFAHGRVAFRFWPFRQKQ